MHSEQPWLKRVGLCLLALLFMSAAALTQPAEPGAGRAAEAAASAGSEWPTREAVNAEADKLRADPQLGGTHKEKTLRWKPSKQERKHKDEPQSSMKWLRDFAEWISAVGRVTVWVVGAVLVALLLVGLRHWVREHAGATQQKARRLPSHVRDLDIRPESLPDRIGAAAAALWQGGEHRPALSLLYRGALSRLVHDHAVPIRAASTEGECVLLAAKRLDAQRGAFFSRLVSAWQLAVYGARLPASDQVLALCADFDATWGVVRSVPGDAR